MRNLRLLIADDNAGFVAQMTGIGESLGFSTVSVADGRAFQQSVQSAVPDIAAFDVFLREVDGLELINWLAYWDLRLPLLLFTSRGEHYLHAGESLATLRSFPAFRALDKATEPSGLSSALQALTASAGRGAPAGRSRSGDRPDTPRSNPRPGARDRSGGARMPCGAGPGAGDHAAPRAAAGRR